jgi:hypothetical protein
LSERNFPFVSSGVSANHQGGKWRESERHFGANLRNVEKDPSPHLPSYRIQLVSSAPPAKERGSNQIEAEGRRCRSGCSAGAASRRARSGPSWSCREWCSRRPPSPATSGDSTSAASAPPPPRHHLPRQEEILFDSLALYCRPVSWLISRCSPCCSRQGTP